MALTQSMDIITGRFDDLAMCIEGRRITHSEYFEVKIYYEWEEYIRYISLKASSR